MINPNGDELGQKDPLAGSTQPGAGGISQGAQGSSQGMQSTAGTQSLQGATGATGDQGTTGGSSRFSETTQRVSTAAGDAWRQTKQGAGVARERTEFLLRENPVPTVIGALAIGLAIGLAIRYSSETRAREVETKTPFGDVNLGMLSLPFLWPFFKNVRRHYEDTAVVVKDRVSDGVDRLKSVDVDDYVKPLRKKWRNWTN
jgi:ElaB/YqjD/DUF883 family membrane-anchored ribosome-binding protein